MPRDRLEKNLSQKPTRDVFAAATSPTTRWDGPTSPDLRVGDSASIRPNVRLDPGHHRSKSRWLGRDGADRRDAWAPDLTRTPRCAPVVVNREATVLAAMVNWITGPEARSGSPDSAHCLASVAGPTTDSPVGVVQFWPEVMGGTDYLLTHTEGDQDPSITVERYSLQSGCDWWAGDLRGADGLYRFRVYHQGNYQAEIRLAIPGLHHVLPALAAVAISSRFAISPGLIRDRLEEFSHIPRIFESRGTFRGVTLIDDEAVAAGEVGSVLHLARQVFGRRPIRAVYLPASLPATADGPSAREFDEANHLILIDQPGSPRESTRLLAARLRSSGTSVVHCANQDQAIQELDRDLEPGDVLITLGASEVGTIADAFLRRLSRDHHG